MLFLDNLKVSVKVALNSGLILLLLAAASGELLFGLSNADGSFGEYRLLARQTNAAAEIEAHLVVARVGVRDFLQSGGDEAAKSARDHIRMAVEAAGTAKALFTDPEVRARTAAAEANIVGYGKAFDSLVPLRDRRNGYIHTMNEVGPQADQAMADLMEDQRKIGNADAVHAAALAVRHLLLARLYANRFLVENGQEQVDRVAEEFKELRAGLARLAAVVSGAEAGRAMPRVASLVDAYEAAFHGTAGVVLERNAIVREQLDALGPKITQTLEGIRTDNKGAQDVLGPRASASLKQSLWIGGTVACVAVAVGLLLSLLIGRGIAGPVSAMTAAMGRLAGGDKSAEIPAQGRRDEVGAMAAAVQVFKDSMIQAEQLAAEQEKERSAREARGRRIEDLTRGFDAAVAAILGRFAQASQDMQATASSMSSTAEETNRQATAVAAASEQAAANVEAVASASEELSGSIEEIGRQVTQSSRIASRATADAEASNAKVQALAEAARKVGEVVTLIQDIAAQTNLLALNATIEAARAGEAGKGFAVVASEVKTLATQTARATEEIGQHIGGIQAATGDTVATIRGIGGTISEMNEIASSIASAMEEQGAATREIARNVQEAARGTQEVTRNIAGVTQAAAETGAAAEQVNASAGSLLSQSDGLRRTVETFLADVRAA